MIKRRALKSGREKVRKAAAKLGRRNLLLKVADIFRDKRGKPLQCIKEIVRAKKLTIVRLQGAIDSSTITRLDLNISKDKKNFLDRHILLDFKDVVYVDSATLAYIIFLLDKLQKRHRKLGIINTIPLLKSRFEIEKLEKVVRVYKNEDEALRDLR